MATTGQYDAIIKLGADATEALNTLTKQLQATAQTWEKTMNTSAKKGGKSLKEETSKGVSKGMKEGSKKGESFFTSVTKQIKNRLQLTIAQGIVDAYKKAFSSIISNVKELNDAQTEFKKVSNLTGEALDKYSKKAAQAGKSVGRSSIEMMNASVEFKKSGYNETDALKLAKLAS